MIDITSQRLREVIHYDPGTGIFRWRNGRAADREAGTIVTNGYRAIMIGGKWHRAHRLAWLFVYGKWPEGYLDHIDGTKTNNRISNLREATRAQNEANKPVAKSNALGIKGVCQRGARFQASIKVNRKTVYLGLFKTSAEAAEAYRNKVTSLHGDFVHPTISEKRATPLLKGHSNTTNNRGF